MSVLHTSSPGNNNIDVRAKSLLHMSVTQFGYRFCQNDQNTKEYASLSFVLLR